ncbi:MAG: YeeE/YedE family protein [Xanthobacteraceae bacterium]
MNELSAIVIYAGLSIGIVFGAVSLLSGFCLLSGLRGWWIERDSRMIRTFALAVVVAIAATQALAALGFVDLGKSLYLQPSFSPALILLGGALFGYGMVLANGCASRALVLLGSGNLRSLLVVMTIAVTAQITLKGLIAPARLAFLNWSILAPPGVSLSNLLSSAGLNSGWAELLAVIAVSGSLLMFALAHAPFRRSAALLAAGVGIGLTIGAGWFATGYLGADDFNPAPVASLTFIAPVADTLQYMMLSTGLTLSFGVALVSGTLAGSFFASLITRRIQLEGFTSARQMLRYVIGAALMGSGGAMAYGCTIGQGLTGLSTLALPSFIAVAGILAGTWAALRVPSRVRAPRMQIRANADAVN